MSCAGWLGFSCGAWFAIGSIVSYWGGVWCTLGLLNWGVRRGRFCFKKLPQDGD